MSMHSVFRPVQRTVMTVGLACTLWGASTMAQAQSQTSAALSVVPVASAVMVGASVDGSEGAVAMPLLLSAAVTEPVVEALSASADGVSDVTRRAADGVSVSQEVSGTAVGATSLAVGTVIEASAMGTGLLLAASGEVLAFIPNAVGSALLHNERL